MAKLQDLSTDEEYYQRVFDTFEQLCDRRDQLYAWIGEKLPRLVDSIIQGDGTGCPGTLKFLSIGPGNGAIDFNILSTLRITHPRIQAVIIEPNPTMMQQYRALVSKESAKLQGVHFEWRSETFDEFKKISKPDKFHFISSMSSIYYMGEIEQAVRSLYNELDNGGMLMVTLMSGEGGFGRLWQYLHKKFGRRGDLFTSSDVIEACGKLHLDIFEIQNIIYRCDLSACFDPPEQLSEEGNTLLDFLTHTIGFARNASAECREDVMNFLRSEACSERGSAGEVLLRGDNVAIFIQHE